MGTRADFYVGRGKDAEWLGSVAMDGYPDNRYLKPLWGIYDEATWRNAVAVMLAKNEYGTVPDDGWPWPWEDSRTTDYAYAFEAGAVHASCFGSEWFDPLENGKHEPGKNGSKSVFPDMTSRQNVTMGKRSGILLIGG